MTEKPFNLIHGDCLEVMKMLADNSIDCVVTDCPYKIIAGGVRVVYEDSDKTDWSATDPKGVLGRGRRVVSDGTICSNKWVKRGENDVPSAVKDGKMFEHNDIEFSEWLPEVFRVLKPQTHCYIMVNGRNLARLQVEAEKAGFVFQNLKVWEKNNATPNKYYMQNGEFILMLSKRPARNINNLGDKTIFRVPNIIGNKLHPTQKPVELMKRLIRNSTNENEVVLDLFMGSGSTGVAAMHENRKFIGIEKEQDYFEIAKNRIESALKKEPLFQTVR